MAKAQLEISFGPNFLESRTLTWKRDGLIIFPTVGPTRPSLRISDFRRGSIYHEILGEVPHHVLWFSVYCTEETAFLDSFGDEAEQDFLVGDLLYARHTTVRESGGKFIQRYYVQLVCIGSQGSD